MEYNPNINIQADFYQPGDEVDILALNQLEYGATNIMVSLDDFRWRYANNPAGPATICVVRNGNSVIGFVWIIPSRMHIFGQDHLAAMIANLLIHPEYRNSLAYTKLIRQRQSVLRQQKISFHYSFPIEAYFERTRRLDSQSSFLVPLLIRPLNVFKLAHTHYNQRWLQQFVGGGGQIVKSLLFRNKNKTSQQYQLHIEWLDQFDDRFNDLWKRVQNKYSVTMVRDQAFLAWRFASVSERTYRTLIATSDDKLVGYVVLRCTDEIRGIPTGLVMDFLLEPTDRGKSAGILLMTKAWQYFQSEDCCLAGGLALPHTTEYQIMRRAGYRPCPPKLIQRIFRVAFKNHNNLLPDTTQIQANDWFITIADYEAH